MVSITSFKSSPIQHNVHLVDDGTFRVYKLNPKEQYSVTFFFFLIYFPAFLCFLTFAVDLTAP